MDPFILFRFWLLLKYSFEIEMLKLLLQLTLLCLLFGGLIKIKLWKIKDTKKIKCIKYINQWKPKAINLRDTPSHLKNTNRGFYQHHEYSITDIFIRKIFKTPAPQLSHQTFHRATSAQKQKNAVDLRLTQFYFVIKESLGNIRINKEENSKSGIGFGI